MTAESSLLRSILGSVALRSFLNSLAWMFDLLRPSHMSTGHLLVLPPTPPETARSKEVGLGYEPELMSKLSASYVRVTCLACWFLSMNSYGWDGRNC